MSIRLGTGFISLLFLLTVVPAHAAESRPAALNLVLADFPSGFVLADNINVSVADAAAESGQSIATLLQQGHMDANEVSFQAGAKLGKLVAIAGIFTLDSKIVEFHTIAQATGEYQRALAALVQEKQGFGLHPLALGAVGNVSTAWTAKQPAGNTKAVIDLVLFTRGHYVVNFNVVGQADKVDAKVLNRLTHIVDHRIQAHG